MKGSKEAKTYKIEGIALKCMFCSHDRFWTRTTLMNSRGATFFNLEWLNKEAENYICDKCGYVHWFFAKSEGK